MPLDAAVFPSKDLLSASKSLDVFTNDSSKSGVYNLKLVAYFTSYSSVTGYAAAEKEFLVEVKAYCEPLSVTATTVFEPSSLTYTIFDSPQTANFLE